MQLGAAGLIEIASHEGICLRVYRDSVGTLTWGIGHTAAAGPPDPATLVGKPDATLPDVFAVFRKDLTSVQADVNWLVKVPLTQAEFDALCSFHYNTGGLARAQLLVDLNAGNYSRAAQEFLNWLQPPEIEGRRRAEMTLFRDGTYSSDGKALVFPVDMALHPLYGGARSVDVLPLLDAAVGTVVPPPPDVPRAVPVPVPTQDWLTRLLNWLDRLFGPAH